MPWLCNQCQAETSDDDLVCPTCSSPKTSWTMVRDTTRTFQVSGRRMLLKNGAELASVPVDEPLVAEIDATEAYVMEKAEARAIMARNHRPPSRYVLHARLLPRRAKSLAVTLEANFDSKEVEEDVIPNEGEQVNEHGFFDTRYLFVYGEGDLDGIAFPGIHVKDLSEDTPDLFAPSIDISALKKKPHRLPTTPAAAGVLHLRAMCARTYEPLAGRTYTIFDGDAVQVLTGTTDAEGVLRHENLPADDYQVALEGIEERFSALVLDLDDDELQVRYLGHADRLEQEAEEEGEPAGKLHLQALCARTYEPLAGRAYTVFHGDAVQVLTGTTDAEGVLCHEDLPDDDYQVALDGIEERFSALLLDPEDDEPQVRYLGHAPRAEEGVEQAGPHWIEFRIEDADGNPQAGVAVILTAGDGEERTGETDAAGVVRWEGLPPEGCTLRLSEPEPGDAEDDDVDLVLGEDEIHDVSDPFPDEDDPATWAEQDRRHTHVVREEE